MNILEFADLIDTSLEITYHANQNKRFSCNFRNSEVKESEVDPCLTGLYGNGFSPLQAINAYTQQLNTKVFIIINAMTKYEKGFRLPKLDLIKEI